MFAGAALIVGVAGGAIAYALETGVNNTAGPHSTPTPEQLQKMTGRQVYVMPVPGNDTDSSHGVDLGEAEDFCIRVGSGPDPDDLGFNPLPEFCNTNGLHDAYYSALSLSDLGQVCINAGGEFRFVTVNGDFRDACLTDIPLDQG